MERQWTGGENRLAVNEGRPKGGESLVAGTRQALRAIAQGRAALLYLARDAAPKLRGEALAAAQSAGVPVDESLDMAALGRLCRIAVPCAAAAVIKPESA